MTAGDRFQSWIEGLSEDWKDRLSGWAVNLLAAGAKRGLKAAAPTPDVIKKLLDNYKARTGTSIDLTEMVEWLRSMEDTPIGWFFGIIIMAVQTLGLILSGSEPLGNEIKYAQYRVIRSQILDPISAITAWRRRALGVEDPIGDLKSAGFSEDRIETLKAITEIIPNAADIVRFALREVYTPEIAEQYGQFQDIPTGAYPDAEKAGLSEDMFKKFWAAHWGLPSASDGFEMLHRGILTEDQLKGLLKANDIMPYWRDQLIKLSWNIPTRVDVRRFWDMRTIDEARLREIYTGLGYHGQDLDDYVLWTKIYVDFPDLLARYKNGWITLEDVKRELVAMGMKPERADKLIEEKVKKAAPERVAAEKALTKAEIVKGVKLDIITRAEGVELLQDMGYGPDEAAYIMAINLEVATGSPHNFAEFKDLTQGWRLAAGMEGKPMTEEIKKLGAEVVRLSAEVSALEKFIKSEQGKLVPDTVIPVEATARVKELQATL
jgi:hypothetical protein